MIPSRCRTGTSSPNRTPASSVTNASPGNRRLLRDSAAPPSLAPARWAAKSRPKARRGRRSSLLHLSQGPQVPPVGAASAHCRRARTHGR
jgi:hypothetical protein